MCWLREALQGVGMALFPNILNRGGIGGAEPGRSCPAARPVDGMDKPPACPPRPRGRTKAEEADIQCATKTGQLNSLIQEEKDAKEFSRPATGLRPEAGWARLMQRLQIPPASRTQLAEMHGIALRNGRSEVARRLLTMWPVRSDPIYSAAPAPSLTLGQAQRAFADELSVENLFRGIPYYVNNDEFSLCALRVRSFAMRNKLPRRVAAMPVGRPVRRLLRSQAMVRASHLRSAHRRLPQANQRPGACPQSDPPPRPGLARPYPRRHGGV